MMRPVPRLGAPAIALVLIGSAIFTLYPTRPGFALDDLVKPLLSAKSGTCQTVVKIKGPEAKSLTADVKFKGTFFRQDRNMAGRGRTIHISDDSSGKSITLHPERKIAQVIQVINRDPKQHVSGGFLQSIRNQLLGLDKGEKSYERISLGERKQGRRTLIGYRIKGLGGQTDIWGDPATGLPHTIVSEMEAFPNVEVTVKNFKFDVDLDDSLFSLEPPKGYDVSYDTLDMSKPR